VGSGEAGAIVWLVEDPMAAAGNVGGGSEGERREKVAL
jgi:hypothetical protein